MLDWIAEEILSSSTITICLLIELSFLTLFISFCKYHRAFYDMFGDRIEKINRLKRNVDVKSILFDSIGLHLSMKG